MSAPDPLAKLRALTKTTSGETPFQHESETDVLRRLTAIFTRIPAGQTLIDMANRHGIEIKLLKGRNDFSFSPDTKTVYLGLPAGQSLPRARMLLHLAMGLAEAEQEFIGMPRPSLNMPKEQFAQIHVEKQRGILFYMCVVAHELVNQLGLREILDELTKMGHINLYKAYEEDLRDAQEKGV